MHKYCGDNEMTHRIMSGATSPQKTPVALEVEVELGRMGHCSIDHGPGRAVAAPVSITFVLREEAGSKEMCSQSRQYHQDTKRPYRTWCLFPTTMMVILGLIPSSSHASES